MGMTIIEKIFSQALGGAPVIPGDIVDVPVDTIVLLDTNFYPAAWRNVLKVADPAKVVIVFDHRAPASDLRSAEAQIVGRDFARQFGITRLHDIGRDGGIAHTVIAEQGYARPGSILICDDSHTCAAGAFNCAGKGVGEPDMIYSVVTGRTWFSVCPTVRYDLTGELARHVTTKDLFLTLSARFGQHTNQNVEFGGPGLASLSIDARRTLATMAAELSAEFATFEADDVLVAHLRALGQDDITVCAPDASAQYIDRRVINLADIEPRVALPDAIIGNTVGISQAAGAAINQAFIGSCANGNLEDFAIAASILDGHRVAPGVRLIVTPSSQAIYRQALRAGYVGILSEAGAIVTNATCGACCGGHLGVLGPNEVCLTASTRNFKGRMGDPTARIFMGSVATVAASAITGIITDPRGHVAQ
jgi:3-isopropylmalate/(R)-2-methylmalate dehydratase large subunit